MIAVGLRPLRRYAFFGATFDPERKYRYRLWRIWDTNKPRINWIMLNPSTTEEDPSTDDATIRRVSNFTEDWGYGGFEVGNLYALRSKNPRVLLTTHDPVGPLNDNYLFKMHGQGDMTICAWGNNQAAKARQPKIKHLLADTGVPLYHLGLTQDGCPKHPLYLKQDTKPVGWG